MFLHTLHVLIWRAYIVAYLIEDVTVTNEMSQLNRHAKAACGIKIFHSECIITSKDEISSFMIFLKVLKIIVT